MKSQNTEVVVRFPPSPTGEIHIGNVRTLLFNYLFAKKHNGKIVFRFEDTDKERSKKEYEQPMLDALQKLGLSWDGQVYRQSERTEIYKKYLKELIDKGLAYEGEENTGKTGRVVRLKNTPREIYWKDLVKGEIKINTNTFKDDAGNIDIILARSIDDPIYHFTVVVDDWLMGVTHVLRGDDHMTSTPRQIMILEALGAPIPEYAHLPTIVGADKKKLSKRNGTTSLQAFFDLGYLPETITNYLALLGWNPGDEREFFTLPELIQEFSLDKCQVSPAQFDFKKLDHINKHYIQRMDDDLFIQEAIKTYPKEAESKLRENIDKVTKVFLQVYKPRVSKVSEIWEAAKAGENNMYFDYSWDKDFEDFDVNKICFKGQTMENAKENLKNVLSKLEDVSEEFWKTDNLKSPIWDWSEQFGRGNVLHPLRMTMSLKEKSPDPFTIMDIIGRDESLRRLKKVIG